MYTDESLLLRELNHRINNDLTSAICAVSSKAVESDNMEVKLALLDVVDLLHEYADVHGALRMPDRGRLRDAAQYLQQLCASITKCRLAPLTVRVMFSADDLLLENERSWKLGLIVSELLTNVARHAQFDSRNPVVRVELCVAGNVAKCRISDNGSVPEPVRRGRGLTIIGELANRLGGRIQAFCDKEGSSFLLSFPLTRAEQRAARTAHVGLLKRRGILRCHTLEAIRSPDPAEST
ncbi:ATP-binding protein [Bradyrhizobium uaiense]|uniref:histidine kinase n=1 Tax=Bradyrhizobium uaiense TaxID=2594946 RepID=A0A6P1BHJ1_9BRAD|nr:sensor histidine kinase [Bradyrhizobium uaiense]NEU97110.1 sensor histidine kinase [Bradyrhizobium uaiense]